MNNSVTAAAAVATAVYNVSAPLTDSTDSACRFADFADAMVLAGVPMKQIRETIVQYAAMTKRADSELLRLALLESNELATARR